MADFIYSDEVMTCVYTTGTKHFLDMLEEGDIYTVTLSQQLGFVAWLIGITLFNYTSPSITISWLSSE
jgi:hypothetical protein